MIALIVDHWIALTVTHIVALVLGHFAKDIGRAILALFMSRLQFWNRR